MTGQMFHQPWMNRGMQVPFYQQPMVQQPMYQEQKGVVDPEYVEEKKHEYEEKEQLKEASNNMIDILARSDNPKHRNSKFLKFLKKLAHGAYIIEDEQLVKNE